MGELARMTEGDKVHDYEVAWEMPFKSQEFSQGPELLQSLREVRLRLDHETESGDYVWSALVFHDVHAVRFTAHASCTRDQVHAYDRLVRVPRHEWLDALPGVDSNLQHFRIYFDEFGCYDVVAADFQVREET